MDQCFYHPNWIHFFADQADASDNRREIYDRCGTIWLFQCVLPRVKNSESRVIYLKKKALCGMIVD